MAFKILGTGSALPSKKVTNDDLSKMVDTSDEWIISKTGIKTRHILSDESLADIAKAAAESALADAKTDKSEIDLIICATMGADYRSPGLAAILSETMGIPCAAFDVNSACTGFIYALDVADGFFCRKKAKKILVVAADAMSRFVDWTDRATCVLFGDGAGAVLLGAGDGYLSSKLTCEGNAGVLNIPCGAGNLFAEAKTAPYLYMNGQEVYRFAVSAMSNDVVDVVTAAGLAMDDISYVLPHQANARIIKAAGDKLGVSRDKILVNIQDCGNMSAASIPVLLDVYNKKGTFKPGDILVMSAFGGGLTTGACVIRW